MKNGLANGRTAGKTAVKAKGPLCRECWRNDNCDCKPDEKRVECSGAIAKVSNKLGGMVVVSIIESERADRKQQGKVG